MNIDVLTTMQRSFGVHRKTGRALVGHGSVRIGGEVIFLTDLKLPLERVRGKSLAIPSRNLLTFPWGSPSADDPTAVATGDQLTLA